MIVRDMNVDDLPELMDMQQAGAVVSMATVFPQDLHPFPRDTIVDRWRQEIDDSEIATHVAVDDGGQLIGFAATCGSTLLHFGTAIDTWGSGTASELLEVVVDRLRPTRTTPTPTVPTLRVFAGNGRARRFYEKHGWRPTGSESVSDFEPHPLLLEYSLTELLPDP